MAAAKKKKDSPFVEGEQREIPEEEKVAVTALLGEISRAKKLADGYHKSIRQWRKMGWGTQYQEEGTPAGSQTRTNIIYASLATLLPHIYAKNPEISVSPTEAVGDDEYEQIKGFCKTAQVLLNRLLIEEAKLKPRAKANIRSTMFTAVGWLKLTFQESLEGDPIILRRAADVQDNLRRVEYLAQKIKAEDDITSIQKQRQELRDQYAAIRAMPEIGVYKGFVLDRVSTEDMLILDESVVEFDDYAQARKLAMGVWMRTDLYEETFGHKPYAGTSKFGQPQNPEDGEKVQFGEGAAKFDYVRIWEVWDKTANTVYTVAEGSSGWCRAPYPPDPVPERWYSFYCLAFNPVEGRWRPLSDIELIHKLQDEYNTTRYLFAEARKEAIATWVFRKSGNLTEEDIQKLSQRRPRQFIGVEGNPTVPLDQDIAQFEGIKIDPNAYDVTLIRNDIDMMIGLSDASRANLIEAKTATEAEIMRQALALRASERQDSHEDMISDMGNAALQIALQRFDQAEVTEIVGEGAVWPGEELTKEDIFRKVRVSVRAGSTGKPNLMKEREQWKEIMPVLKDTMAQVAELRMQGQFDMADSLVELLKETFKRYDERLDVDQFIPRPELGPDGQPVQQQNMVMQAEQTQEQLQLMTEELQACKEELAKCQQDLAFAKQNDAEKAAKVESDAVIAQAQESSKAQELRTKEAEALAKQAEAEAVAAEAAAKAQAEKEAKLEIEQMKQDAETERTRIKEEEETKRHERTLENQKAIAELTADAKVKSAKKAEGAAEEGAQEPATDTALAKVLGELASAVSDLATADTVPEYNSDGSIKRVTRAKRVAH